MDPDIFKSLTITLFIVEYLIHPDSVTFNESER